MKLQQVFSFFILTLLGLTASEALAQELPQPTVLDIAWHPREDWLAVADTDGLRLIDSTTEEVIRSFPVSSRPVYATAWSPDGLRLVSGGADGELKVWDASSGELLANLVGHPNLINTVAWNSDGSRLASSSLDFGGNSLRTWEMTDYQAIAEKEAGFITRMAWSHDNSQLFVSIRNGGGTLAIDAQSTLVSPLTYDLDSNLSIDGIAIDIHPTSNLIAAGATDGNIYIQDTELNQTVMTLSGHTGYVTDLDWSSDGRFLTSVSIDGTVKTWDTTTGQLLGSFGQEHVLYAVAISPDGTQVAYGGEYLGGEGNSVPIISSPQTKTLSLFDSTRK